MRYRTWRSLLLNRLRISRQHPLIHQSLYQGDNVPALGTRPETAPVLAVLIDIEGRRFLGMDRATSLQSLRPRPGQRCVPPRYLADRVGRLHPGDYPRPRRRERLRRYVPGERRYLVRRPALA